MASGVLLGLLSGLGNLGEQRAQAREYASDEIVRRLAQQQQIEEQQIQTQRAKGQITEDKLRSDVLQQQLTAGRQKKMVGNPYVAGGKQYARYLDPITGQESIEELQGPIPETQEEAEYRGLVANFGPEVAQKMMQNQYQGRAGPQNYTVQPDANSFTGWSKVYYAPFDPSQPNAPAQELGREPTTPQAGWIPRRTDTTQTDPAGFQTHTSSIRQPVLPGAMAPAGAGTRFQAPTAPPLLQTPQVSPQRPAAPPSGAAGGPQPTPAAAAPSPTPANAGPYNGLDSTGHIFIPPNTSEGAKSIIGAANDLIDGTSREKLSIPMKWRESAANLAKQYGWKGQGSLTPAQQMQVKQVDASLRQLYDPQMLKVFDDPFWRRAMRLLPIDPTTEGGFTAFGQGELRDRIPQQYRVFLNELVRLRGVITGIRGFTGANNSNATADRMLAELPNFTNTSNSADAASKLAQLSREVAIIKRLGYFLSDDEAGSLTGPGSSTQKPAPAEAPPATPPPGAKVRDFSQLGP